jgi:hypothetical protein
MKEKRWKIQNVNEVLDQSDSSQIELMKVYQCAQILEVDLAIPLKMNILIPDYTQNCDSVGIYLAKYVY